MYCHRLHLQNISITNFALYGINTTAEMWKYFCRRCSVTAVKEPRCVIDSVEMLLAEQASKQGWFISLHTLGWEFISCVILLEALWWLSRTIARSACFLLCKCNFCSLPSGFGLTSVSFLYGLWLRLRGIFFFFKNKTQTWIFKGFLSLDKIG